MAKKQDKNPLQALGQTVTNALPGSSRKRGRGKQQSLVTRTFGGLKSAAGDIDRKVRGPSTRSEAGKKAARTRKRKAAERSASARKGARKRSKAAS